MAEDNESVEDLYREMAIAVKTRVCPQCGCGLVCFKDAYSSGLRCPKCGWEFFYFGVMKNTKF